MVHLKMEISLGRGDEPNLEKLHHFQVKHGKHFADVKCCDSLKLSSPFGNGNPDLFLSGSSLLVTGKWWACR